MRILPLLLLALSGPAHIAPPSDATVASRGPLVTSPDPIETKCEIPTYTIDECRWDVCNAGNFLWQADAQKAPDGIQECGICMCVVGSG